MNESIEPVEAAADNLHVYLRIFDFGDDPSVVTGLLGFSPTVTWCAGDPVPNHPTARRTHSRWTFKSPLPTSAHVSKHIETLLPLLEPFASRLRDCAARFPTLICCAIYYQRDFTPSIHLAASTVQGIAALGVSLDIDLYFLGADADSGDERAESAR